MFSKLALKNVRRSVKDYGVWFLTIVFGVCLFYVFNALESQSVLRYLAQSPRVYIVDSIKNLIGMLSVFVWVVLAFLILYASGFLIRRRKKELGTYLLLGMERWQVARLLLTETVCIGAAALAADYNGCSKASHIKDKLIEMTHLNETLYCCGIACSAEGHPTASGSYMIDLLLANVCKQNVTRFPYEIVRLAEDIAGGLMVTAPSEADFRDPKLGPVIDKYLKAAPGVTVENRLRVLRLIENLSLGTAAVGYRTESMHGAGSPQAQRIMIARQGNLEHKKALAKAIAHIKED